MKMLTGDSRLPRLARLAWLALWLAATLAAPVAAQGQPAGPGRDAAIADEATGEAAGEAGAGSEARALISILRDDAARERLIGELERLAGPADTAAGAAAPGAQDAGTGAADDPKPFAARIAEATRAFIRGNLARGEAFANGLRANLRRLSGLASADTAAIVAAVGGLIGVIAATMAARVGLGRALRGLRRRIAAIAPDAGPLRKAVAVASAAGLDLLSVLLAAVAGHVIALAVIAPVGEVKLHETLYLNAFAMVGIACATTRIFLAPDAPSLRLAPMGEPMAASLMRWSVVLIGVLGYGLMLGVPIIRDTVNIFTARAVHVAVMAVVLLGAMALVIRHRRGPREYFEARAAAGGGDMTLQLIAYLARFWHIAALVYLLALFSTAVRQSGDVTPILTASGKILGAALLGAFVMALLGRASARGVRLPEAVTSLLPLLERRINTFVPAFLKLIRFVVMLVVAGFALQVMGVADIGARLESSLGVDIASTAIAVGLILLIGFLFWLGLASWVEYRLTPRRGRRVTSREQTLLTLLRNAATIAVAVITGMFALSEIGINIAPLLASAGVLGLAIGFGAQRMVQDIITGIFIQFENAINVGDVITVGGTTGTVEKLTIRSVSLRDVQGVFHIIPFSSVDAVSNYMRGFAYHVADIGIAYREDIDEARRLMLEAFAVLRESPEEGAKILGELEWFGVQSLGDSAVVLRARIKTRPGDQWSIGRAYNEAVKKRFDAAGVEIPFPHMTIWFGEGKDGTAPPAQLALPGRGPALDAGTAAEPEAGAVTAAPGKTARRRPPARTGRAAAAAAAAGKDGAGRDAEDGR